MKRKPWVRIRAVATLWLAALLLAGLGGPLGAAAPASAAGLSSGPRTAPAEAAPVVRVVMFWLTTCPHCHDVLTNVLPPLRQQYGPRLDVRLIESSNQADWSQLVRIQGLFGIPANQVGVPFMIVGTLGLLGADQIRDNLPSLVERAMATGGLEVADVPGLPDLLIRSTTFTLPEEGGTAAGTTAQTVAQTVAQTAAPARTQNPAPLVPAAEGAGVAIVVFVIAVTALVDAGQVLLGFARRALPGSRVRLVWWRDSLRRRAIPALALLGLGVAAYLTYVQARAVPAICGPLGDCNAVQHSAYARLLGVPLGVFGLATYAVIFLGWLWTRLRHDLLARCTPAALLAIALAGTAFSAYLTFLEPFVIGAVCSWCLTSAVLMTLLLVALLPSFAPTIRRSRHLSSAG